MSRRVALVIGNQDCDYANKLYWPEKDALDMARLFEDLGFNEGRVFPYRNQDNGSFRKLVDEFAASLRKGDLAAFYFSGHGVQDVNGDNHLLPTDAKFYTPQELASTAFCRRSQRRNAPASCFWMPAEKTRFLVSPKARG